MVTFHKVLQPGGRSDATRSWDQVGIKLRNFGSKQNKQQSDQLDKNQVLLLQKSSSSNDSYKKKKKTENNQQETKGGNTVEKKIFTCYSIFDCRGQNRRWFGLTFTLMTWINS